jgi:hypothetical protein
MSLGQIDGGSSAIAGGDPAPSSSATAKAPCHRFTLNFMMMSARTNGSEDRTTIVQNYGSTRFPHPEERPLGRVSKDGRGLSWFETREDALLTMRT